MTPVTQTKVCVYNATGTMVRPGNCYAAAVATIMDLAVDEVPNVEVLFEIEHAVWDEMMTAWLKHKGKQIRWAPEYVIFHSPEVQKYHIDSGWLTQENINEYEQLRSLFEERYYFVSGKSPRGVSHITIWKDGKMVWDPHPSRDGISLETSYFQILENL